jgi:hypothetical protein
MSLLPSPASVHPRPSVPSHRPSLTVYPCLRPFLTLLPLPPSLPDPPSPASVPPHCSFPCFRPEFPGPHVYIYIYTYTHTHIYIYSYELFGCEVPGLPLDAAGRVVLPSHVRRIKARAPLRPMCVCVCVRACACACVRACVCVCVSESRLRRIKAHAPLRPRRIRLPISESLCPSCYIRVVSMYPSCYIRVLIPESDPSPEASNHIRTGR